LWYPLVLNLYGGLGVPSMIDLVQALAKMVALDEGLILDVACGPGTLSRRIASQSKAVYGIDVSMGMLRKGAAYVERDHIPNVHFARAKAELAPFPDAIFNGALCGFALHLFPDTVSALREIGRTMKEWAPLGVTTFTAGNKGILRFRRIREHVQHSHGAYVFELSELERHLIEAGFENFQPQTYGSILVFGARKRNA
jgi:ubiquinone/menaquinone biosynthesis C-methylase UbiE